MSELTRGEHGWNSRIAAGYGCTVAFENDGGKRLVLQRVGPPTVALAALCDAAVALDPSFRVVSYSTPETLRVDLRGRYHAEQKDRTRSTQTTPEGLTLSRIGRLHLLHPRMRGMSEREARYRAKYGREPGA